MTAEEKLIQIEIQINNLKEELEDILLLENYYSGIDPKQKVDLEAKIKKKDRAFKLIKIIEMLCQK